VAPRIPPVGEDDPDPAKRAALDFAGRSPAGPAWNIFATLANHPSLFGDWWTFASGLLQRGTLPVRDRELLLLRTGWNCRSEYEWGQHVRVGKAAGLTDDEIVRITAGPDAPGWDDWDATLLRAADELHDDFRIGDATWDALSAKYSTEQLIEVPLAVGQYHLVSMTLNTLGVERDPGVGPFPQ
jgi:alkylhydroperoxidase family enzyme